MTATTRKKVDTYLVDELRISDNVGEALDTHLTNCAPEGHRLCAMHQVEQNSKIWIMIWERTEDTLEMASRILQLDELLARRDERISDLEVTKTRLTAQAEEAVDVLQQQTLKLETFQTLQRQVEHMQQLLDAYKAQRTAGGDWSELEPMARHARTGEWCKIVSVDIPGGTIRIAPQNGVIIQQRLGDTGISTNENRTTSQTTAACD